MFDMTQRMDKNRWEDVEPFLNVFRNILFACDPMWGP